MQRAFNHDLRTARRIFNFERAIVSQQGGPRVVSAQRAPMSGRVSQGAGRNLGDSGRSGWCNCVTTRFLQPVLCIGGYGLACVCMDEVPCECKGSNHVSISNTRRNRDALKVLCMPRSESPRGSTKVPLGGNKVEPGAGCLDPFSALVPPGGKNAAV